MSDPVTVPDRQARLRVNWRGKLILQLSRQVVRFDGPRPRSQTVWEDATPLDLIGSFTVNGPMTVVRQ